MASWLLLDENVEHEVCHRLENYGHDVVHVDFAADLGNGTDDAAIAQCSRDTDRIVRTDDDFVCSVDEGDYRAVLSIHDATLSMNQVADVVHTVSQQYPQDQRRGLEYIGDNWLRQGVGDGAHSLCLSVAM